MAHALNGIMHRWIRSQIERYNLWFPLFLMLQALGIADQYTDCIMHLRLLTLTEFTDGITSSRFNNLVQVALSLSLSLSPALFNWGKRSRQTSEVGPFGVCGDFFQLPLHMPLYIQLRRINNTPTKWYNRGKKKVEIPATGIDFESSSSSFPSSIQSNVYQRGINEISIQVKKFHL